jgi:hypothetical protein
LIFFPSWAVQQNNTDVGAVDQFSYRKWLQLDANLNMKKMHSIHREKLPSNLPMTANFLIYNFYREKFSAIVYTGPGAS